MKKINLIQRIDMGNISINHLSASWHITPELSSVRSRIVSILILISILIPTGRGYGQEVTEEQYESRSIYLKMSLWRPRFVQNSETHKTGFIYLNLTSIIERSSYTHDDIKSKESKKLLTIPNPNKVHAVLILGYPKRKFERIAPRFIEDVRNV